MRLREADLPVTWLRVRERHPEMGSKEQKGKEQESDPGREKNPLD